MAEEDREPVIGVSGQELLARIDVLREDLLRLVKAYTETIDPLSAYVVGGCAVAGALATLQVEAEVYTRQPVTIETIRAAVGGNMWWSYAVRRAVEAHAAGAEARSEEGTR